MNAFHLFEQVTSECIFKWNWIVQENLLEKCVNHCKSTISSRKYKFPASNSIVMQSKHTCLNQKICHVKWTQSFCYLMGFSFLTRYLPHFFPHKFTVVCKMLYMYFTTSTTIIFTVSLSFTRFNPVFNDFHCFFVHFHSHVRRTIVTSNIMWKGVMYSHIRLCVFDPEKKGAEL